MDTTFRLSEFEGPLDLLLRLIERRELDITRVSLAQVADQYLELITRPGAIELSQLADYLVISARLILIKSRSLLPQPESGKGESDEVVTDDLARQLREYKMFKTSTQFFREREKKGLRSFPRHAPPPKMGSPVASHVEGLSFDALFSALRRTLALKSSLPTGKLVEPLSVSIHHHLKRIREHITRTPRLRFTELLEVAHDRVEIIVIFLAVLESIKRKWIIARQEQVFGEIVLERTDQVPQIETAEAEEIAEDWM